GGGEEPGPGAGAGRHAESRGWQPEAVTRDHLRRCGALLSPGEEDFGIVPVEAMACGAPVIAYGRGGATETVLPPGGREPTGLWFSEQTADCLAAALAEFEKHPGDFSPAAARRQALRFNAHRFRDELFTYLDALLTPSSTPLRRAASPSFSTAIPTGRPGRGCATWQTPARGRTPLIRRNPLRFNGIRRSSAPGMGLAFPPLLKLCQTPRHRQGGHA